MAILPGKGNATVVTKRSDYDRMRGMPDDATTYRKLPKDPTGVQYASTLLNLHKNKEIPNSIIWAISLGLYGLQLTIQEKQSLAVIPYISGCSIPKVDRISEGKIDPYPYQLYVRTCTCTLYMYVHLFCTSCVLYT